MLKNRSDLFSEMTRGATIITPNNRLSNQLLRDFIHATTSAVHDKPRCLPYPTFIRDCFKQVQHHHAHQPHPILFSSHQERVLWQSVISDNDTYPCTNGLLQEVQDAWTRCQLWGIDIESDDFLTTPQTQQFQRWHRHFVNHLKQKNAITEAQLVPYLLSFPIDMPCHPIIWVSFDDFTPQQQQLRAALATLRHDYDIEVRPQTTQLCTANDTRDELNQLIMWLNAQLDAKTPRIAVIVPDLQQQSNALQRRLLQSIPASQFELSLGNSFTDYPLVSHALHWLALDKTMLSNHQVRLLLHSPYLGGALSEFTARSKLLEENHMLQEAVIPYTHLLATLQKSTPQLYDLLVQLSDYPSDATPFEWIAAFKKRLSQLAFPGEYTLNSSAFQTFQRLQTLFDDFLPLALVHERMTQHQALNAFCDIAKKTVFQVRKTPRSIQVLGLLEASGCEFDSIWVMGLTDQCLPQKVRLTPFIPLSIQRDKHMPHALPERELQLAKQLLNRLHNGSKECVFSYPQFTGDTPNLPSPLVRELPIYKTLSLPTLSTHSLLQEYQEHYAYPLTENEAFSGGTALLANQAKCPFRAFAAHRLHTREGLKQSTGLNNAERGQVIHKILEIIWTTLGSQARLLHYTSSDLDTLIDNTIHTTLASFAQQRSSSFSPLIQSIERQRLKRLVLASLAWEKQREPFVVKAIEQAFTLPLAGLDFHVRVDRLDMLSENETWVIDYKSSLPINKPWNEVRPEAPQLLLYALLDTSINALLFLQLKTGQIACSGISQEKQEINGLSSLKKGEAWSEKRAEWHERLTTLAIEFREGHCAPVPQRNSTCLTCEFKDLCRFPNNTRI